MERFYDGDQDQLFTEARVVNPFRKSSVIPRPKVCYSDIVLVMCCERFICFRSRVEQGLLSQKSVKSVLWCYHHRYVTCVI